jgi:hypothetical protein
MTPLAVVAALAAVLCFPSTAQESAPASAPNDAEAYERTLREERVRHLDLTRRLEDEEQRLRIALDAAKMRLAEAETRRASLRKLLDEVESARQAVATRLAGARAGIEAVGRSVVSAARRFGSSAAVSDEALRESVPLARRVRLVFQALDREIAAARTVAVSARAREGVLGHDVKLGLLGRFFVPAAGGRAIHEPSGRELGDPVSASLREVVRQATKRGRGSLVTVPWWGGS